MSAEDWPSCTEAAYSRERNSGWNIISGPPTDHPVPITIHATEAPYYGSEKQLKWANDIKARFQLLADATEDKTLPDIPYAKFWIERRNSTLDQLRIDAKKKGKKE